MFSYNRFRWKIYKNRMQKHRGGASVAPQVPLQLQLGQQQQQQQQQLLLEPPTPPLTPVTAISGGGSVHHQPPPQQHLRSVDPMHSAGAAVAINSFSVKANSGGFSDFVQKSTTGQGSMTTTVSSASSDNRKNISCNNNNNNSSKSVNKNNNNNIPDQTQPQNLIVFDKNNKSADNLEQQNLQSQQSKLLQLQLEQFKLQQQMQQQQQLSPYHHHQLQQQQQQQQQRDLEKMSYEKLNLNLSLNLNSQQNHLNFHQLQTNNNDKNFVNNLKRVVDTTPPTTTTTTAAAAVSNTPTKFNHQHHHHHHIVATTNKANHNDSDDQPLDRSSSSVAFDLSSNKEDDSNMAADLADDNDPEYSSMEQTGYDDSYESKVYLRSIESILEKSTLPQFFSPLLHMGGGNQHETTEKNLLVDFEKLLTKYSSYLECGSEQCQLENVREHCHCCDEQCVGKILNKKEEIERHLKWHRKRMDSLNYGFLRFSSSDNCAPQFVGCPHNRKQTHYHCLQNNCDKTYISTSDVQMHANFHKKDSAIIQEGFQRYRATEECKAEYCMFFGQRTTHFHCRRDNCKYTFKNRADMEKHKTYHMKDEQLLRNGFKKFLKADPCPYSTCRFSQVCNHIHCIRENCEYVLHSSGQLLSHRRKHERMDSEKAYRRFKMTQKMYDTPVVSGAGSTADANMPIDLSASRPSTSDSFGHGNGNGVSDEESEEEEERAIKDERDSNDDSMSLNGLKKEDELDIHASYIPKIPGLPLPGSMPGRTLNQTEEFLKLLPNTSASTPPLSVPAGTPPISDDKASEAASLVDNLTLQQNFQLAYLALCQQNPFYFQGLYQLLGLPGLADPNKLLQAQLEQQQQAAGTSGGANLLMPPAFPFSPESLLRLPHELQLGLPNTNAVNVPPMTAAMKQRQKRKLLHPDIDMSLTTAAKKLKNQANYKHNSNVKVFKDETVPEGYLKFRFNEDCNFANCGYRNHQSHFHCCRADCFYSFCDKTRFVQHTARHERLDKLMGDDFKQYRANMRCEFDDCTYNRNLGPNNKSSHFHCLKCDFICADTSKVVAHRRQHSKMEFIQMAGFRKVSSNENCLENAQPDGSSDSGRVTTPSVANLVLPFCTETPGDKPSPSGQSLSQPTTPTSGASTPSLNNECTYCLKQTHYHCLICDGSVLSRAQIGTHRHRTL